MQRIGKAYVEICATAASRADNALRLKAAQGVAQRIAANVQQFCQWAFGGQPVTGPEPALCYHRCQPFQYVPVCHGAPRCGVAGCACAPPCDFWVDQFFAKVLHRAFFGQKQAIIEPIWWQLYTNRRELAPVAQIGSKSGSRGNGG